MRTRQESPTMPEKPVLQLMVWGADDCLKMPVAISNKWANHDDFKELCQELEKKLGDLTPGKT